MNRHGGATSRRGAIAAGGLAHFTHDGFTDTIYVLLPFWAQTFGLSLSQVGFLKFAYYAALAVFQVPVSLVAERLGERRLLVLGTAAVGGAFVALGAAGGFLTLAVLVVVAGSAASVQHPLASSIVSRAHPGAGQRAALSIYNFTGDIGKMLVPAAVVAISALYGWRTGSVAWGLTGLAIASVLHLILTRLDLGPPPARADAAPPVDGWGVHDRGGFAVLSAVGMIDTAVRMGFLTFLPFALIAKGAAVETAGFSFVLLFAGGAAGKLVCGMVAERLGIVRTVALTEVATALCIVAVIVLPLPAMPVLLPVAGVMLNGTSSVLYGTVTEFVHADRHSRAFGLFYTLLDVAAAVAPLACGVLADAFSIDAALLAIAGLVLVAVPMSFALAPSIRAADARRVEVVR